MVRLTDSEEIVMKSVWELGGNCILSAITEQAKKHGRVWQLQTVATFLKHLGSKGFVRPYKDGRFLHYEVLVSEKAYKKEKLRGMIDFWNNGNGADFVCSLLQEEILSREEENVIRKLVDK